MATLTLIELPARFGEPDRQIDAVARLMEGRRGELVLLSECAISGYLDARGRCDPRPFAEDAVTVGEDLRGRDTSPLARLASLALETESTIVAPAIEHDAQAWWNSAIVIDRSGRVVTRYRKRHPWYPEVWASPGHEQLATFDHEGVRVAIAICFDVHFLAAESAGSLTDADVLLFPSAWVDDTETDARRALLAGVAARFDLTIANANWGPGVPRVRGQGGSRFVRPSGREELLSPSEEGGLLSTRYTRPT